MRDERSWEGNYGEIQGTGSRQLRPLSPKHDDSNHMSALLRKRSSVPRQSVSLNANGGIRDFSSASTYIDEGKEACRRMSGVGEAVLRY